MSFVDKTLMPGESIAYRGRLHWNVYVGPLLLLALVAGLAFAIPQAYLVVAAVAAAPAAIWLLVVHVQRVSAEFAITSRRIVVKTGVLRQNSFETMLSKVEGIQVHQGILDRMFDCGTLVFSGTGGNHTEFKNIRAPLEFRRQAQIQIEAIEHARASRESLTTRTG